MLELNGERWVAGEEGGYVLEGMDNMRLATALIGLEFEIKNHPMKMSRISAFGVVKEYFYGLKRTKAGAFKQLEEAGIVKHFVPSRN